MFVRRRIASSEVIFDLNHFRIKFYDVSHRPNIVVMSRERI